MGQDSAATGDGLTTILASRFCPPDGKIVTKNQARTLSSTILHPDPTPNYGFDLELALRANIHHLKTVFSRACDGSSYLPPRRFSALVVMDSPPRTITNPMMLENIWCFLPNFPSGGFEIFRGLWGIPSGLYRS